MFSITNKGTNKLKTATAGIVFGDTNGRTYENNKTVAKTELIKNKSLFKIEYFFIYFFPCLNKNSFSSLVKVS